MYIPMNGRSLESMKAVVNRDQTRKLDTIEEEVEEVEEMGEMGDVTNEAASALLGEGHEKVENGSKSGL